MHNPFAPLTAGTSPFGAASVAVVAAGCQPTPTLFPSPAPWPLSCDAFCKKLPPVNGCGASPIRARPSANPWPLAGRPDKLFRNRRSAPNALPLSRASTEACLGLLARA